MWVVYVIYILYFVSIIWASINYFVYAFRGSEFVPADLLSLRTAFNVVEEYQFKVGASFLYAWFLMICVIFGYFGISNFKNKSKIT